MMVNFRKAVRVRNPHSQFLEQLGSQVIVDIAGRENRATGLYFLRQKIPQHLNVEMERRGRDKWRLIRTHDAPRVEMRGRKYTWFC